MTTRTITIQTDGITVSRLAWDLYRSTAQKLVERIYALNPGLGKLGVILPVGTPVVTDLAAPVQNTQRLVIKLWD